MYNGRSFSKCRVGIVGCGAMGAEIARAIDKKTIPASLAAVCDIDLERCHNLLKTIHSKPLITTIAELARCSDIIVEAAGASAVPSIIHAGIRHKKPALIMSVGYFLNDMALYEQAGKKGCRIIIPSGAIAGIDAVKASSLGVIRSACLTTTKPPRGLLNAPYFKKYPVDLGALTKKTIIFTGIAKDAVRWFPANINVSAILSIAGIGPRRTRVTIIADPSVDRNIHEIEIIGTAGRVYTRTENLPSPANPKTSYLAILSAISALREFCLTHSSQRSFMKP
jgi:aspartate dehydrogenase